MDAKSTKTKVFQISMQLLANWTEVLSQLQAKINRDSSISEHINNLKNIEKMKGKISVFKDSKGLKIAKKNINNISDNSFSAKERELYGGNNIGSSESFVYSTQDTKENKFDGGRFNQK